MKNKRYIIKKGKARISFSDIDKAARMNGFTCKNFRYFITGRFGTYNGWSLEYIR